MLELAHSPKSTALTFCLVSSSIAWWNISDSVLEFLNLILLLMNGLWSESMNGRINISVCEVDGSTLEACLVRDVNLEMYSCIGVSFCLRVFNLCFAMMALPNWKPFQTFLFNNIPFMFALLEFLLCLYSEPLVVNIMTSMLVLPVTSDSLSISSNQDSKSLGLVPSQDLALLRNCSFEVCAC